MLYTQYDIKVLRFNLPEYCYVGDRNAAPSFCMSDTAYADGSTDASDPNDVKLLRSAWEPVSTLASIISRNLNYRTALACTMTLAPLTMATSSIPYSS